MSSTQTTQLTRTTALLAPVAMIIYAVLRWFDGVDGDRGPGVLWTLGHLAFGVSVVGFGLLTVSLWAELSGRLRAGLIPALVGGIAGIGVFLVMIIGDLVPALARAVQVPGWLLVAGPTVFVLSLTLLMIIAAGRPGSVLRIHHGVLVLVGFLIMQIDLDQLPLAAVLLLLGLRALGPRTAHPPSTVRVPA